MLTQLDRNWLEYARRIFSCPAHLASCDAPRVEGIDPSIRWPGFLGENYQRAPKRMLFVGRVHNPSGWTRWPGLGGLESIVRDWLNGNIADDRFYRDYSREYARRLATWGPWAKVYGVLANAAGADETSVAYVNAAKCWQFPGKESRLQRACSAAFPLEDLVDIVKPHAVFLLATDGWVARVPGARVRTVPFRNDSAPHFQIPSERMRAHIDWIRSL